MATFKVPPSEDDPTEILAWNHRSTLVPTLVPSLVAQIPILQARRVPGSFARSPLALHEQADPRDYGGQHRILDDRRVLLHERPLDAEHPPEADQRPVLQGGVKECVE